MHISYSKSNGYSEGPAGVAASIPDFVGVWKQMENVRPDPSGLQYQEPALCMARKLSLVVPSQNDVLSSLQVPIFGRIRSAYVTAKVHTEVSGSWILSAISARYNFYAGTNDGM